MSPCQDVCVMTHGSPAVRPSVDVRCMGEATTLVEFDPAAARAILFIAMCSPCAAWTAAQPGVLRVTPLPRNQG